MAINNHRLSPEYTVFKTLEGWLMGIPQISDFQRFHYITENIVVLLNFRVSRDFSPYSSGFRSSCSEMKTDVFQNKIKRLKITEFS